MLFGPRSERARRTYQRYRDVRSVLGSSFVAGDFWVRGQVELQARITWDGNTTKVPAPTRWRGVQGRDARPALSSMRYCYRLAGFSGRLETRRRPHPVAGPLERGEYQCQYAQRYEDAYRIRG